MGRQSVTTVSAKASTVAAPALPSTAAPTSSKSSILKASFSPSRYQLRLFASVIQGFESQQLRIHDTNTGRLRCQHNAKPLTSITCLDWGQFRPATAQNGSGKKNSRSGEDVVVAYGTSDAEIVLFSPAAASTVGSLVGGHERGIRDFKFSQHQRDDAWSLGGDGKLVQWNLKTGNAVRSIALPDPAIHLLSLPNQTQDIANILCAFTTPYMLTVGAGEELSVQSFDSMRRPVTVLLRSNHDRGNTAGDEFFLSADTGRHIHVYSVDQKNLVRTLLSADEVTDADLYHGQSGAWTEQLLSVTTKDGAVELFMRPFVQPTKSDQGLESSRKNLTKRATAKVYLVSSDSKKTRVPIFAASLQGPELHVVSVDSGVELAFQKIRWQDEGTGELLFDGVKEVARNKAASTLNTAVTNGAKTMAKTLIDESRTVVVNGGAEGSSQAAAIELDDSDDGEEENDDDEADEAAEVDDEEEQEDEDVDTEMHDASDAETAQAAKDDGHPGGEADEEPSFGDLVAARNRGTIDIASFAASDSHAPTVDNGVLSIPTGLSLGTVLTQALRTNDRILLEACLHTTDHAVVANTIQRLQSSLAGTLLGKIAERMASRPGRYGDLQVWVQQLCVAHGAVLSTMPEAKAKLKTLFKVLDQRAKTLQPLLLLKGKLDMLDAQLRLRRQLAAERVTRQQQAGGVVLVEGEADNWSSDEDIDADEEEDDDEEDSDMDSFIDDGPIEQDPEADDPLLDDDAGRNSSDDDGDNDAGNVTAASLSKPKSSTKPAKKRSRR
ncbi:hypothetical protein DV738_g371, partial [Chaetothyriales sp. CBS 135597]